jgi:DNA-binding CsgD family transcriptional regulator
MSGRGDRGHLLAAAARAAAEAVTVEDLAGEAMRLAGRALGANYKYIIELDATGTPRRVLGDHDADAAPYFPRYWETDPITDANRRAGLDEKTILPERHLERGASEKSAVYNEFYHPRAIDRLLVARMTEPALGFARLIGLVFFRARTQPEFGANEVRDLARVLPAFEAAARRSRRADALLTGLLRADAARLALDATGRLLWMSPAAEALLGGARRLPDMLVAAARNLALSAAGRSGAEPSYALVLDRLAVELRVARAATDAPFVVAECRPRGPAPSPKVAALAARFGLTAAETDVLAALCRGQANEDIARARFVTVQTVKSHVHRILNKLGVKSRLQAALLAR